jgi:ribosomal protein L32
MAPGYPHAVRSEMLGEHPLRTGEGRLSQHHLAMPSLIARPQIGEWRRPHVQCLSHGWDGRNGRDHKQQSEPEPHRLLHRVHHVEDRQVHRDHHAADDHAEHHDHHRLHQGEER